MGAILKLVPSQLKSGRGHAKPGGARVDAYTRTETKKDHCPRSRVQTSKFKGGNIKMPTKELVYVWSSVLSGSVRPSDVRTWLAARELFEERKFAPRGVVPVYEVKELVTLIGGGGERQIRASLRRLRKAGVMSWQGTKGPRFADSPEFLAESTLTHVSRMEALMPKRRAFFPMPRPMLRLLAGGVKRSVLATVFAHLLRCPHLKNGHWDPVGAVKANWVEAAFGISERSAVRARSHLVNELGWLTPVDAQVWRQKANGGYFSVNLQWCKETPAQVAQLKAQELSTAALSDQNRQNGTRLTDLESEQPLLRNLSISALQGGKPPEPPVESSSKMAGENLSKTVGAPKLTKLVPADLPSVARIMELYEQALVSPKWKAKGWSPSGDEIERLNWVAAARRAHVRGSTNPCGVFIHLVTNRKWEHISNEDEQAVRSQFSEWRDGVEAGSYSRPKPRSYGDEELVPAGYVESMSGESSKSGQLENLLELCSSSCGL